MRRANIPDYLLSLTLEMNDTAAAIVDEQVRQIKHRMDRFRRKRLNRLKNLDFFVLDNSIRESTIGQLRGHTLKDKIEILNEIKKTGIKDIIVASFSHATQVDDDFCQWLVDTGEDTTNFYSFSEVTEGLNKDGAYDIETIPISLRKNKKYGLRHTIFEIDLANSKCDWGGNWTVDDHCQLLLKHFRWVRTEIDSDARIFVNFRDFSYAMSVAPERLLRIVHFVAALPPAERIFGFVYEDLGDSMPEELESWTAATRAVMDAAGWSTARLLIHVHEQWGLPTAATLGCLARGADGVWASVCEEGAVLGHASSSVTVMNLVRLGNTKVLEKYNCTYLRKAARKVTQITTGRDPHPKQVIYGDRALDSVFGFPMDVVRSFDVAGFFGMTPPSRMSTLASAEMIRDRLVDVFGEDAQFTVEIGQKMKDLMLEDLRCGRKEEYMSADRLTLLFDRAGGKVTEKNEASRILRASDKDGYILK